MKKIDIQLAHEAVGLMECIEDKFSLLDELDNVDIPELIEDSKRRISEIFAHLNSVYNPSTQPLKSTVAIAEEYHRMTQEEFDVLKRGEEVEYDGLKNVVGSIRYDEGLLYLKYNGWVNFDSCKLIK